MRALLLLSTLLMPVVALAQTTPPANNGLTFKTQCAFDQRALVDPIVAYGAEASHLHDLFGAPVTSTSYFNQLRAQNADRCKDFLDDESAYWIPTWFWGDGTPIDVQTMSAYYFPGFDVDPQTVKPWPQGYKVVSGDGSVNEPQLIPGSTRQRVFWTCAGTGGEDNIKTDLPHTCADPTHAKPRVRIYFPDCIDGRLDSDDHRSHASFSVGGICDAAHPKHVPMLQLNFTYNVTPGADLSGTYLSNNMSDPRTSYGFHADFLNGWTNAKLTDNIAQCVKDGSGCGFIDPSPPTPTPVPTPEA